MHHPHGAVHKLLLLIYFYFVFIFVRLRMLRSTLFIGSSGHFSHQKKSVKKTLTIKNRSLSLHRMLICTLQYEYVDAKHAYSGSLPTQLTNVETN